MPVNVVKTPRQEHLWKKAKVQAENEGKSEDWAYIMGIFKHMGGMDKTAGFIKNVLGKNVGEAKSAVGALKGQIKHTKETVDRMNEGKGFFAKHVGARETRKALKPDYENLKGLKGKVREEQGKTFKARAGAVGVAGVGAGAAYGGDKLMANRNTGNNDELKPQYLASEKDELIEKVAKHIMKEAAIGNRARSFVDSAKRLSTNVWNVANRSSLKEADRHVKALEQGVRHPGISKEVDDLLSLRERIEKLEKRNKRLTMFHGKYSNPPVDKVRSRTVNGQRQQFNPFEDALNNASTQKSSARMHDTRQRSQQARRYADLIAENKKLLEAAGGKYTAGAKQLTDRSDKELQKIVGLYGGIAGSIGYGINKAKKDKKA